jgi:hypothetical protein
MVSNAGEGYIKILTNEGKISTKYFYDFDFKKTGYYNSEIYN